MGFVHSFPIRQSQLDCHTNCHTNRQVSWEGFDTFTRSSLNENILIVRICSTCRFLQLPSCCEIKLFTGKIKLSCQWQAVTQLSFSFPQVLRGGDGQAGFAVRHPNGNHVLPYQWRPSAEYEEASSPTGGSICFQCVITNRGTRSFIYTLKHKKTRLQQCPIHLREPNQQRAAKEGTTHQCRFRNATSFYLIVFIISALCHTVGSGTQNREMVAWFTFIRHLYLNTHSLRVCNLPGRWGGESWADIYPLLLSLFPLHSSVFSHI